MAVINGVTVATETISYGSDYKQKRDEFLNGEVIRWDTPVIDTCIYVKPNYKTYLLPSKRVVQIVDNIACSIVHIFGSIEDYEKYKANYWSKFADPETGKFKP